jgi:multidrug efflux pump
MISHFFIDRPIFATVLSVVITLAGAIAVTALPIAQYPQITPPSVAVSISYPGASAQIVADTVAAPIEQSVNGVPGMLYMSSQSGNDGSYSLSVIFEVGTNLNTALVMVQNRVMLSMPLLPTQVQSQGITIRKKTPDLLMVISFYSPDGRFSDVFMSNYVLINLKDQMLRVSGVSDVSILGERDYSIRAWLDPQKIAARGLTAVDVANAIRDQNADAAAGELNASPSAGFNPFERPIDALGRLWLPEQFEDIIVKVGPSASLPKTKAVPMPIPGGGAITVPTPGTSPIQPAPSGPGTPAAPLTTSRTSTPLPVAPMNINKATGPASSSGGGTTPGGAAAVGGGTTGGGATGSAASMGMAGLSINSTNAGSNGMMAVGGASGGGQAQQQPAPPAPGIVRLRDVARVELGALNYNQSNTFDMHPAVGMGIFQLPGTNALDVADRVRARMAELKKTFPEGIEYEIAYDTTPFISESVADVVRTLFEAIGLVGLVVLVFLQNWRAVIIPMVAVPVAIIGTFAVMAAVGFSLNNISLFGLVLAIGIVVDDAIVVVENVERWLAQGLPPREATRKAMDEVTGPIIAVALVLCAVFVPCAFIPGITGRFFRQFAVTIAVSTVFSALNSLTLSPALAAILLRAHIDSPRSGGVSPLSHDGLRGLTPPARGATEQPRRDPVTWLLDMALGWLFRLFNLGFAASTAGYGWVVSRLLHVTFIVLLAYAGLLGVTYLVFLAAPTGFIPQQDQGRLIASIQLPDASALWRTQAVVAQAERIALQTPGVAHTISISGMSFAQQVTGSNFGSMFIVLKPFGERRSPDMGAEAIMARLRKAWNEQIKEGMVVVFGAPPVPGVSVAGGVKLIVEDRGGMGIASLQQQTDTLVRKLQKQRGLTAVTTSFRSNTPQLFMDIDRTKVASLNVSFDDANKTLGIYLGSLYVNSFNQFGRHWQVTLQAEGQFRSHVSDVNLLQVRNLNGQMVPMGTLVRLNEVGGPIFIQRYNLYTAAPIMGGLRQGASTGEVGKDVQAVANETLPLTMGTEWTELMFLQNKEGNNAASVFALAVLCVFLALAALYESWSLPLAVILVVPLCLLCSVGGVIVAHLSVDIFVQIGLVVLVGLACKNAILIVEFAKDLRGQGKPRFEATVEASRLRLRPILMTSFAFILGVLPLVIATGAGAEMRRSLGTAVFTGMFGVTLFGIFLTPVFFYVIQGISALPIFSEAVMRWVGSGFLGAFLGAAIGYLLVFVNVARLPWAPIDGAAAGALAALLLVGIHQRIRR